jgi:DNA repair protein RadC
MREQSSTYRITDMAASERPRERLARLGAESLTTPELLAILLRVGVAGENVLELASRLLQDYHGITGLHRAPFAQVCQEHGIGQAKAAQIKAALELGHRLRVESPDELPTIHSPGDAADLVMFRMGALEQEELDVILLDVRNHVVHIEPIYRGSVSSSQVRVGEVFKEAVRRNAVSIIVVHNHPSGDPTPSPDDVVITRQIVAAGKLLDIQVLDHLVIGMNRWISLKERGLGFNS